jgi:hypothetical protein
MPAQQANGLELVGCEPGYAPFQQSAQVGPLVQHPLAAGTGRLQAMDPALELQ